MKKIILILTLMLTAFGAWAQSDKLASLSKELNKQCPREIAESMMLNSVEIGDSSIIFNYTIPASVFKNMESLGGILHDSLLAEMESTPDETIRQVMALCKENKYNIVHRYTEASDQESTDTAAFNVIITSDEL